MNRLLQFPVLLAIGILAFPAAADPLEGEWLLRDEGAAAAHLTLSYREFSSTGNWNQQANERLAMESLRGLDTQAFRSRTGATLSFEILREAGTFACEGWSRHGRASGHYTFNPDEAFSHELARLGYGTPSAKESLSLALSNTGMDLVREIARSGYDGVSVSQLVRASHHGVTAAYVRDLRDLGFHPSSLDALVRMRDHGVTIEFAREILQLGIANLDERDIVRLRDHGVTPDFVRGIQAAGLNGLDARQLVRLRDHGVTPDYARAMSKALSRSITPEELVRLRDHGVRPEDVADLRGR